MKEDNLKRFDRIVDRLIIVAVLIGVLYLVITQK